MRIVVFDYGAGNLHSLVKAIDGEGRSVTVETDPHRMLAGDVLVLPGVGAFGPAAAAVLPARTDVADAVRKGHPCLGICLGLQLLLEESDEGAGAGLGVFSGRVTRLRAERVPHIGWNSLDGATDPLFGREGMTSAYFANGYVARPTHDEHVIAWSTHERDRFPAAIRRGRTMGVQFHPEKSSVRGVRFLRAALTDLTR